MHPRSKKTLILLIGFLVVAGLGMTLAYAQEAEIELNADPTAARQRSAVAFSHELHMGLYECLDCHHKYENGVNVLDEDDLAEDNPEVSCAACHDDAARIDRQRAFHRQCMGCHIQVRKAGGGSGPEMCGSCHRPEA
jgi:c(7)-type cytochrome triheme protein